MAGLTWSSPGTLRRLVSSRSALVWLLLVLLLAGAASYTHGSRYALVGHSPFQSVGAQSAGAQLVSLVGIQDVAPPAGTSLGPGDTPASASQAIRAIHQAGLFVDPESVERDCCERRQAPRSEPAPLRTGAVDPPSVLQRHPSDAGLSNPVPPGPELQALTVVQLSISRT